ncbi:hypothetical protein ACFFP0_31675 [Rhizobium puerariae]|uniref:DUF3102 domain-containing protein n=1 Tax=Rhizobium puerariae TaxID=1585791 RepID=A0ABV6AS25_9HYPH
MATKPKNILDRLGSLFSEKARLEAELRADIDAVELELITAQNRLAEVRRAPVPRAVIEERVDRFLAHAEAQGRQDMVPAVFALADFAPAQTNHIESAFNSPRTGFATFIAIVGAGAVRDKLVEAAIAGAPGVPMSEEERDRETKRLTAEIDKLERIRERFARESESVGVPVPRSEFADPSVLLMPDEEL